MLDGRRVRLRVFGLRFVCQARTARWIEYRGYVPETVDVVRGLSECDLLFLPQPFGPQGRPFAEYSFPTKFTTYLAAGRPILVLAPPWSALNAFCREHQLPIVCDQLDDRAIRDSLRRLAGDLNESRAIAERLQAVAESEFSRSLARSRLAEWLGDDHSPAAPVPVQHSTSETRAFASHH
jgi:hypothetical protein